MSRGKPDHDLLRSTGLRLAAARLALGLTQEQMATGIGVERNAYANWEGGSRLAAVPAMLRLLARYRVTLEWVYAGVLGGLPADLQSEIFGAATRIGAPIAGASLPFGQPAPAGGHRASAAPRGSSFHDDATPRRVSRE